MKYSHSSQHRKTCPHDPDHRAQLGFRLRAARCNLGWSMADAAKNLQVTERTWHNWENGSHRIPYAVYKLLRVMARLELPGTAWAGWSLQGGNLVTPENHVITPKDGAWWSLMVRKANGFLASYHEANRLRMVLQGHGIDPTDGTQTIPAALHAGGRAAATCGHAAGVGSSGLVPFKTSAIGVCIEPSNGIMMTSQCSQPPLQAQINDVIITSWPILYDSIPPLTHLHATGQPPSVSASTPSCPSPWTPTCDLRSNLARPSLGPHPAQQPPPRPPSRPPRPPKLANLVKPPNLVNPVKATPASRKGLPALPVKPASSARTAKARSAASPQGETL